MTGWRDVPMSAVDFRVHISPLSQAASRGKYDWRTTVQRLTDGTTKTALVSGGWTVAESYAEKLAHDLGLPASATRIELRGALYSETET